MLPRTAPALAAGLLLVALLALPGARCTPDPRPAEGPQPLAGLRESHALGWVPVPLGLVDALGGNLVVARRHLAIDTRVVPLGLGATYNSVSGSWRFSFDVRYDGAFLVEAGGALHVVSDVPPGRAIPGTGWVRVDGDTLMSKGGLVHEFGAGGRLAAVHWRSAEWPRLAYRTQVVAGEERVVEIVQWSDPSRSLSMARIEWDAGGRVAAIEDRAGRRAEYVWDAQARLVEARGPRQVREGAPGERFAYQGDLLTEVTSPDGERALFGYARGRLRLARAVGLHDPTWAFGYEDAGGGRGRARVSRPDGGVAELLYDAELRPLELVNEVGERTTFEWSGARVSAVTTPDGVTTRWVIEDDDAVQWLAPSGNVVTVAFEPSGENRAAPASRAVRETSDLLGPIEARDYDADGRLVAVRNGAGDTWRLAWGADGGLASVRDPAGHATAFLDRGHHGHARRIEAGGQTVSLDYDAVGNRLRGPSRGGIAAHAFDADRNLVALELFATSEFVAGDAATLSIERRADGRVLGIRRPGGADSDFVYDALGRLALRRERVGGAWQVTRFEYDAIGRRKAAERPNGMRVEAGYDLAGRPTSVAILRDGVLDSSASLHWERGRLAAREDSVFGRRREELLYDVAGRVRSVVYPDGEVLLLDRDLRGRVVGETYRSAGGEDVVALAFAYDAAGREAVARADGAPVLTRTYQDGRLRELAYGNGWVRSFSYDAGDGLLLQARTLDAAGALVESTTLEREVVSGLFPHLLWRAETLTAGGVAFTSHEHFALAPLDTAGSGARIARWSPRADGSEPIGYSHDALGQRVGSSGARVRTLEYDAEGSLLLRVRRENGGVEHSYAWDAAGFASARDGEAIEWDGAGRPRAYGSRFRWFWDSFGRPVAFTRDGRITRRLFGGRIEADVAGRPTRLELGLVSLDLEGAADRHRLHDFRGNAKVVGDAAGRVTSHVRYAPFGSDRVEGAPDEDASFAFGASAGDLLLLGARLYDPEVGRFLAPDPVPQWLGGHTYTLGNPVFYWDPGGRSAALATGIAAGTALGVMAAGAVVGPTAVGVGLVVASTAFLVGLHTPVSATSLAAAQAAAAVTLVLPVVRGLGLGFWAGQEFQLAVLDDFANTRLTPRAEPPMHPHPHPRPPVPPRPAAPGDVGEGGQTKEITIEMVEPGCSPTAAAAGAPGVAREMVLALALLHVGLGWAWVRRIGREGRRR